MCNTFDASPIGPKVYLGLLKIVIVCWIYFNINFLLFPSLIVLHPRMVSHGILSSIKSESPIDSGRHCQHCWDWSLILDPHLTPNSCSSNAFCSPKNKAIRSRSRNGEQKGNTKFAIMLILILHESAQGYLNIGVVLIDIPHSFLIAAQNGRPQ